MAGYVKDDDHAILSDVCHYAWREGDLLIVVQVSTTAGLQAVTMKFDTKGKRNTFWTALLAAMP